MAKKKRLYVLYFEKKGHKDTGKYLEDYRNVAGKEFRDFTKVERKAKIFPSLVISRKVAEKWNKEAGGHYWFVLLVTGGENKFIHLMGANPEKPENFVSKKEMTQLNLFT